jgi:hypothetical protein
MPAQVDAPTGLGPYDEWALWGAAADKLQAVATNDGDTSVIYAASGGRGFYQGFYFPFIGGVADPVTSASITAVVREYAHGAGHILFVLWNAVEGTYGVDHDWSVDVHAGGGNYVTCTTLAAGGGLALAAVNGSHAVGFSGAGGPSNKAEFWCTQVYRTISFDYGAAPAAGDFTHLIGSLAGAFIGGNLLFREMPELSRFMKQRFGKWIRPDEYRFAWESWSQAKFRAWSV